MANKSLLVATGLLGIFCLAAFFIFQKFLHLSISHTIYYCQNVIKSLSFQLPQTFGIALILLFFLTIIFPIVRLLLSLYTISRHKKSLIPCLNMNPKLSQTAKKLEIKERVIQVKSAKLFAYCMGMKSPKIYISSTLVSEVNTKELEAILLHEKSHLDNHDPLVLTLLSIARALFPYFPVLADFVQNFRIEREVRADQSVVYHQGERQPLLSAMRKLLLIEDSNRFEFSLGIGEPDTFEVRINTLLEKRVIYKKFHLLNILITVISILIVSFAAITPVHAIENHEDGKDIMMVCPNDDSCASWCERNQKSAPNQSVENSSHPFSTK